MPHTFALGSNGRLVWHEDLLSPNVHEMYECACGCKTTLMHVSEYSGYFEECFMQHKCKSTVEQYHVKLALRILEEIPEKITVLIQECHFCLLDGSVEVERTPKRHWRLVGGGATVGYLHFNSTRGEHASIIVACMPVGHLPWDNAPSMESLEKKAEETQSNLVVLHAGNVIKNFDPKNRQFQQPLFCMRRHGKECLRHGQHSLRSEGMSGMCSWCLGGECVSPPPPQCGIQ